MISTDSDGIEYECATYYSNGGASRTVYDIFVTGNGAVSMSNGAQTGSASTDGAYKLMTITREQQITENEAEFSSVIVCASTEFANEAAVYGNSDVLLATTRDLGKELVPVDLKYKMFASTEISSMTTQSKNAWTAVLAVVPTLLIIGTGIVILVRRRYS